MRKARLSLLVLLAASAFWPLSAGAQDAAGELRCNIQGGFGVVIAANRALSCTYRRPGAPVEFYTGSTGNIGIDIGPTNARVVTYSVSAAPLQPGVLQGDFSGPGFGAAGGGGIAANALLGPSGVSLLPIPSGATTAFTGLNLSAGLNQLHLQFAGVERERRHDRLYNDPPPY